MVAAAPAPATAGLRERDNANARANDGRDGRSVSAHHGQCHREQPVTQT